MKLELIPFRCSFSGECLCFGFISGVKLLIMAIFHGVSDFAKMILGQYTEASMWVPGSPTVFSEIRKHFPKPNSSGFRGKIKPLHHGQFMGLFPCCPKEGTSWDI